MANKATDTAPIEQYIPTPESDPTVQIYLPLLEQDESGTKVDQTEHVTINGDTTIIQRGVYVSVKVPVFLVLKVKYPNL